MIRCFTKHGNRAHYTDGETYGENRAFTLCWRPAFELKERSLFWRRRLAQAPMCARCEANEELFSHFNADEELFSHFKAD